MNVECTDGTPPPTTRKAMGTLRNGGNGRKSRAKLKTPAAPLLDLFGQEQPTKRINRKPEAAALVEVLKALHAHPSVSWAERMNSGAARIGNRFVRFGFTGCPDVLGQLRDGRLLACEVKAAKGRLRPEQAVFLERVRSAGGLAIVARNCLDVQRELNSQKGKSL